MIHFVPDSLDYAETEPTPYAEAVTRLAGLRHALRLVEGAEPADAGSSSDQDVAAAWGLATDSRRQRFDDRSKRAVSGAADGIEALAQLRAEGGTIHPAAAQILSRDIRARLDELGGLFSL